MSPRRLIHFLVVEIAGFQPNRCAGNGPVSTMCADFRFICTSSMATECFRDAEPGATSCPI
jgi:hypothetical protein